MIHLFERKYYDYKSCNECKNHSKCTKYNLMVIESSKCDYAIEMIKEMEKIEKQRKV